MHRRSGDRSRLDDPGMGIAYLPHGLNSCFVKIDRKAASLSQQTFVDFQPARSTPARQVAIGNNDVGDRAIGHETVPIHHH